MLLRLTPEGFYCEPGGFHLDPWRPVERAVITHAHPDRLVAGCGAYLAARPGLPLLRARLGGKPVIETIDYSTIIHSENVSITFIPTGHLLGSSQVKIIYKNQILVFSGDFQTSTDKTCAPFEAVPCHTFVTEASFGLPIFRWPSRARAIEEIQSWWAGNQALNRVSVLLAHSPGKAQSVLAELDPGIGPLFAHRDLEDVNRIYRASGVHLPEVTSVDEAPAGTDWGRALVLAPPSVRGTPWMRRFPHASTGMVSGWMRIRGPRRRRSLDRGFVFSNHADWPALNAAIAATGAERVVLTHGFQDPMVRWLREKGLQAEAVSTPYQGELDEDAANNELAAEESRP
jgi:putative mRNA 3-end processing factor